MKKLLYMFLALVSLPLFSDVLVKEMKKAPAIDGVLAAGEWPWRIEMPFTVLVKGTVPENPAEIYMGYDAERIYAAIKFNVSDSAKNVARKRDLFSKPRVELRFGDGKRIPYFALAIDGEKFPSLGWDAVSKDGVMECAIPFELLPDVRVFLGNVVLSNGDENSSLFPIKDRSFSDPAYHGNFSLGTAAEIQAWKKAREERGQKEMAENEKALAECRKTPRFSLKPVKPWAASPLWKPYVFEQSGKDFHFTFMPRVSDFAVPGKKNTLPLFRDAAYQVHGWDYDRGGREKLHTLEKILADEKGICGYILRNTNAPIYYCTEGGYNTYEKDLQISPEARKEFVEKYGKRLIAFDENESVGPAGGFPMIMGLTGETPKNKAEAYEALKKAAFDTRRTFIRDWAVFYPEFQPYRSPISATFTDHIYLSFGFRMAGNECGPKTLCMPFSNAVSRGAARQYGRPFRTYLTTHEDHLEFPGWEGANRHYTFNDFRYALFPDTRSHSFKQSSRVYSMSGPQYGVHHLDWYRCFVYSYMCGVNTFFDECGHYLMYSLYDHKTIANEDPLAVNLRDRNWYLSPMGEMMSKFYDDIVCREDRGSVFTPVAIMWDLHHGHFSNYHPKPWGMFENTEGDLMMNAVTNSLFPMSDRIWYNRGFRTSRYGDVFDVITNNATQQTLNSYPSIFFCGDVPVDQGFAGRLVEYVKQGGTLAVNWRQMEDFAGMFPQGFFGAEVSGERRKAKVSYSRFSSRLLTERLPFSYNMAKPLKGTEAAVFTADANRDPLVLVSKYGKGRVVLTMPDFLKERYSRETMLNIFGDLMLQLGREALPVSIEGDVEFMVNRNGRGWVVALFNNYGVGLNATYENPQPKPDAKYDVKVTVKPRFKAKSVREWFTGGKELSLVVPSGDVRIIEIADK